MGQPCRGNGGCNEPEILPENDEVLGLFLALGTQWKERTVIDGEGRLRMVRGGLDYAGVEVVARLRGAPLGREEFTLLQAMEGEIVSADRTGHDNEN